MRNLVIHLLDRLRTVTGSSRRRHNLVGRGHLWKLKRDFQIRALRDLGLSPEHSLLDIGCGTLRGGIPIIRYLDRGGYYGFDVRPHVLKEARSELTDHGLQGKRAQLIAGDATELTLRRHFDFIWAFSVFIHLTDEKFRRCLAFVADHLAPEGRCFGNVNVGARWESSWREFPVVRRPWSFYIQAAAEVDLEVTDLGTLRKHGHESGRKAQDEQRLLRFARKN